MQAKAITQLEQKAQAELQRAEESKAEVLQLQERLQEAETSNSQALQALGRHALALHMPYSCMRALTSNAGSGSADHLKRSWPTQASLCIMPACVWRI